MNFLGLFVFQSVTELATVPPFKLRHPWSGSSLHTLLLDMLHAVSFIECGSAAVDGKHGTCVGRMRLHLTHVVSFLFVRRRVLRRADYLPWVLLGFSLLLNHNIVADLIGQSLVAEHTLDVA